MRGKPADPLSTRPRANGAARSKLTAGCEKQVEELVQRPRSDSVEGHLATQSVPSGGSCGDCLFYDPVVLMVEEGTLCPALWRLESKRLVETEWGLSENNRKAKYYQLTSEGRRRGGQDARRHVKLSGSSATSRHCERRKNGWARRGSGTFSAGITGVRMALGATASQVRIGVIAGALRLALAGIAAGTIGSLAAARWIESLLFETRPTDPETFMGILLLVGTVALLAGYVPARRASRIDPAIALRNS